MPGSTSYSFFLEIALKTTAVLGVAALAGLLLRNRSAAIRHLVWSGVFAAILVLPLLAISLPAFRVPLAGSILGPDFLFEANSSPSAEPLARVAGQRGTIAASIKPDPRSDWRKALMFVWIAGTAISFAQIFIGWAAIRRLRRGANPLISLDLAPLTQFLGIKEEVKVLETRRGSMPITYGLFQAVVFVPAEIVEWSSDRLRMVLLHELAHVRRHDGATQLVARTVLGLYWWNPLAWIAWRKFLKDRERATDDLVLSAGACASEYAGHLLDIARSMRPPAAAFSAVPMARRSQLEGRLLAILDSSVDHRTSQRMSPVMASLLAIGMIAPLAAVHAQTARTQTPTANLASGNTFAGTVNNGDVARERRDYDEAAILYAQALTASRSGSDTATALIRLGTVELAKKNAGQAIDDFEQAQKADSGHTAETDMWMAIAQQSQNNLEAADGLYRSALAAEDPNSAAAATTMELYVLLLREEGKQDEANAMQARATLIRQVQGTQAAARDQIASSDVYPIGGDTKAPVLVSKIEPEYTEAARIAKYLGSVLLAVGISADGIVRDVRVIRALGFGLNEKAVQAVKQWRFKPGTRNGQDVAVSAQIMVNFRLL